MDDSIRYQEHLAQKEAEYDARCRRCGACCGVGLQKTVNGNTFKCVSFRRIRFGSWAGSWRCGYKREGP